MTQAEMAIPFTDSRKVGIIAIFDIQPQLRGKVPLVTPNGPRVQALLRPF